MITITQAMLNNCPNLAWMGFEVGDTYDYSTIVQYMCQYLQPNVTMKNNGEHPPTPPKHG